MISERYAVAGRNVAPVKARGERRLVLARPSLPWRERLGLAFGNSVPVRIILAMVCVAIAGLLYLAQASQASVLQFNIADLQSAQVQLNAENAVLRSQATQLRSLQRIDTIATTRLHMTKPDLSTAIWVFPVAPRIRPVSSPRESTLAAQRASSPLAWMARAAHAVESSL